MLASILISRLRRTLPLRTVIRQDWILRMRRFSRRKRSLGRKRKKEEGNEKEENGEEGNETVSNDDMEHSIIVVAPGRPRHNRS
jgi:hypothetical protein